MKKILILVTFLLSATISIAQHGTFTDIRLVNGDSVISGINNGTIFYNRVSNKFRFRENGVWIGLGSGSGSSGLPSLGTALQQLRVNSGGTALEYFAPTSNPLDGLGQILIGGTVVSGVATPTKLALGAANTVLHGAASTSPVYSSVVEGDLGLTDITTANSSTSKHGFLLKLDNNAAHFMDGTGAWTTPAGGSGWGVTGSTALTGATIIVGTTTNTIKYSFSGLLTGSSLTDGAGLWLQTSDAASLGVQKASPITTWEGFGWGTTAGTSQSIKFNIGVRNIVQSTVPKGFLSFGYSLAGGAYADALHIDTGGNVTVATTTNSEGAKLSVNGLGAFGSFNVGPDGARVGRWTISGSGNFIDAMQGGGTLSFRTNGNTQAMYHTSSQNVNIGTSTSDLGRLYILQPVLTSNWVPAERIDPGAHTGITASTPKPNYLINPSTQQWATGALSGQANAEIGAETLAFVGASTATEPTGLLVHAPIAGTNANAFVRPSAITSDGNLFFKTGGTVFGIIGSITNDVAVTGNVGEEINSNISTYTNFTTSATYQNITSIALTAGDWDISAFYTYSSNSATITAASNAIFTVSTTTASASGTTEGLSIAYVPQAALLGTSKFSDVIGPYRVSLSGSTTYYLNAQATFSVGNPQYVGEIRARRIR